MKWIDYTALTLAIIGAIVWGLIGVFQFNLVSFFFGENFPDSFMTSSAYPVYIYLPCLAELDAICKHMYFVPSILYSDNIYILGCV